jgi:hypothetical protein
MSDHGNGAAVEMRKAGVGMFADVEPGQLPTGKKTFIGVGGGFDILTALAFQQCQREENGETGPIPAVAVVIHDKAHKWVPEQWENAEMVENRIYHLDGRCRYDRPRDYFMNRKNSRGEEVPRTPAHALLGFMLTGKKVTGPEDWLSPRENLVENIYLIIVSPGPRHAQEREQILRDLFSLEAFKGTIPVMVDTGADVTDPTDDQDYPLAVAAKRSFPEAVVVVVAPGADGQLSGKYPDDGVQTSKNWQLLDMRAELIQPPSGFFGFLEKCMDPWDDADDRTPGIFLEACRLADGDPDRTFGIQRFHAKEGVPPVILTASFVATMWKVIIPDPDPDTDN